MTVGISMILVGFRGLETDYIKSGLAIIQFMIKYFTVENSLTYYRPNHRNEST